MNRFLKRPALYVGIVIFLGYLLVAIFISGFYNALPLVLRYASTVNWVELGLSIFFSLAVGVLVALNAVTFYTKYKERRKCKEAGVFATIGTAGGLAAGICPLCVTGLFPLILGFFGVTFSFAILPFKGLEIQAISIILLSLSLWMMTRRSFTTFK
ncbi:MAG: hypothetical protein AABX53_03805 [Nanoarchaeota archaeon]|mgnify:CR=1 FL=1